MLTDKISRTQVLNMAGQVRVNIPDISIKRGYKYFLEKRVFNVIVSRQSVQATVKGNYNYLVKIDLEHFHLSRCTCPVHTDCKHMAAIFFYLYNLYEKPANFFTNPSPYFHAAGTQRKMAANIEPMPGTPTATDTVDKWYSYYTKTFELENKAYHYSYNLYFFKNYLDKLIRVAEVLPFPARDLFVFHGCLFTMDKMENYLNRITNITYIAASFRSGADYFFDILLQRAADFSKPETRKKNNEHFQAAIDKLRELTVRYGRSCFNWLLLYRLVWSNCLTYPPLIEREGRMLDKLTGRKSSPAALYNLSVAMAHLFFMLGDDPQTMKTLDKVNIKVNDILIYLNTFSMCKDWVRLEKWLQWTKPKLNKSSYEEFSAVIKCWLELAKQNQDYRELLNLLKSWLANSEYLYEKCLLDSRQHKTWVEFQLFKRALPNELNRDHLKQIENNDLALLLPLYHQGVVCLIKSKKRNAYKMAVRFLKKLKTYYKKLNQTDVFDGYIDALNSRYSRLRALQEEMRKGKLI